MALVSELQKDQGSHLYASIAGWKYPMSRTEYYTALSAARAMNRDREEGSEPFKIDWPWPEQPTAPVVTEEERAVLKAQLKASSAFAQYRTPEE